MVLPWLAITTFNCLSLCSPGREAEIVKQLARSAVICLQGSCQAALDFVQVRPCRDHVVFAFPTRRQDPKAGISIILDMAKLGTFKKYFSANLAPAFSSLRGRVGAVWVQSGTVSLCVINLYFRPDPNSPRARATAILICDWLEAVLSQLPGRCTPVLAMDLNDDGCASALPGVFGPCQGRPPKANATTIAAKLTAHHLAMANTFHPHGPTFYGTTWTSRIDHIAVPTAALPRLRKAFVDHSAGDALQLIVPKTRTNASIARRDHRPLTIFIGISLSYDGPPVAAPSAVRWDAARLAAAARYGELREPFLAALETKLSQEWDLPPDATTDECYNRIVNLALEVGAPFFASGARPYKLPTPREYAREDWKRTCAERLQLRRDLQQTGSPISEALWQLAARRCRAAGRHLRSIRRQEAAETRSSLITLLWQAWETRDTKVVWQVARQIAGCPMGPKRRRTAHAPPTTDENFVEHTARTGPEGGFLGKKSTGRNLWCKSWDTAWKYAPRQPCNADPRVRRGQP